MLGLIAADLALILTPSISQPVEIVETPAVVIEEPEEEHVHEVVTGTYVDELLYLTAENPTLAFTRFEEILKADPETYNTCHGVAHQIGHEAFEHFDFQGAMSYQNALCGGGYIHGVVEARFGLMNERDLLTELPTICEETNLSCAHGIGHGLMITTYLDIPASLGYCDLLPGLSRRNCYDGVWMHIFDLEESGARATGDFTEAPTDEYITESAERCATTDAAYKTSCYFYLPRILAHYDMLPFSSYTTLCQSVEVDYQITCAAGSGHAVMKYNIADPSIAMGYCEQYRNDLVSACKEGASLYWLFAGDPPEEITLDEGEGESKCSVFINSKDRAICNKVSQYRNEL